MCQCPGIKLYSILKYREVGKVQVRSPKKKKKRLFSIVEWI